MSAELTKIHFVGVGGVGMGSLAEALAAAGYKVSGSDGALYDPMKSVLAKANVQMIEGFSAETTEKLRPDLVVIGNVVRKENPEAAAWIRKGVSFVSFPEAVRRLIIEDRASVVCSGTHGKTTTTSWISFLLDRLGLNPSYLIGGVPHDLERGSRKGDGKVFVGEGDEYDSAFFDKGAKFLHYKPDTLVLSGVEFDHADIYRDLEHVKESFRSVISLLPGDGLLIARYDSPTVMELVTDALCPVQTFGESPQAMWSLGKTSESPSGIEFEVLFKGQSLGNFQTSMFGRHNLMNLLSGIVCAANLGQPIDKIRPLVSAFSGVRRRQQILLKSPNVLVDDFAHHPTEVKATLEAVRTRYPTGKLWALFEPRSATARRNVHQTAYVESFDTADEVLVKSPYRANELGEADRFSPEKLVAALNDRGKKAVSFADTATLLEYFNKSLAPGDIVVVMSNGEFDKIQSKILSHLA
ncbi:MAG: hypothetical protein KDD51_12210 [Bdellovibrionales bacterium]|nr:hypothetical protein [Bdellovibrionales bacterium]